MNTNPNDTTRPLLPGDHVRVLDGGFKGHIGIVKQTNGSHAHVALGKDGEDTYSGPVHTLKRTEHAAADHVEHEQRLKRGDAPDTSKAGLHASGRHFACVCTRADLDRYRRCTCHASVARG